MHIAGKASVNDDQGVRYDCDVILRGGMPFLVPEWTDIPDEGATMPTRIIPLAGLDHQDQPGMTPRWIVTYPIPRAVLLGHASPAEAARFRVIERPEIRFEGPKGRH